MKVKEKMSRKHTKSFFHLFFKREIIPLSGRNYSNLVVMISMLFIAFTVIGFAEGSLRYLEQKMKDPFINWITVIPRVHHGLPMQRVLEGLNSDEVRREFFLRSAIGYNRIQYNFYAYPDIEQFYRNGTLNPDRITGFAARTLDGNDPVLPEVFSGKNLVRGVMADDPMDIGLIVTSDLLHKLQYPLNTPYVWMDLLARRSEDMSELRVPVPVPVNAVVKSLPGLAAFTATTYFYQQRSLEFGRNPFNPIHDNRMVLGFHRDAEATASLIENLNSLLKQKTAAPNHQVNMVWSEQRFCAGEGMKYLIFLNFRPLYISLEELDQIFLEIYNHDLINPFRKDLYRLYDYEARFVAQRLPSEYDRLSLNFSSLDRLREFSGFILETYGLEVDMAQIESRENYHFVSRLTAIISLVLIGFSVVSVILFVAFMLKRHLESIRRNLGTFKAFGMSNRFLIRVYVKIVLAILLLATCSALLLAAVFGYSGGMQIVLGLLGSQFEPGNYFSLYSSYLVFALVLLVFFSIGVLGAVTSRILNHTPGDLIYERE